MVRSVKVLGALALGVAVGLAAGANAQTAHRHVRHHPAQGHEIVVHARESYLTAGTVAPVGSYSGYALDTISSTAPYMPFVDHTTVGLHGENRLPNNFTVPGCCEP
jgi:hypothetical protein